MLPIAAIAAVVWVRAAAMRPDHYGDGERRAAVTYRGDDGDEHVYLGGHDSYHWLRAAQNLLRTGSVCDEVRDGECRDTLAHAPVGRHMRYSAPLHPGAIAFLHRALTWFHPGYPLPSSAFWLGVGVAALGVLPAFALGRILAGPLGGFAAALVFGLNPLFLQRTLDADNDVWNVLPLFTAWAIVAAVRADRPWARIGLAALAAAFTAAHARAWGGWIFGAAVVLIALAASGAVFALRIGLHRRVARERAFQGLARGGLVLAVFAALLAVSVPRPDIIAMAQSIRDNARALLPAPAPATVGGADFSPWPDTLASVAELSRPNLAAIAHSIGGPLYFFVGWLGLLVLLLPRRGWLWWHFAIFIAGNILYRYLLSGAATAPPALFALLALPLVAALTVAAVERRAVAPADLVAGQIVIWWFLAALHLSFAAVRFTILLVPPFALAFAVALGRGQQWLTAAAAATRPPSRRALTLLGSAALAAALWIPFQHGRATVVTAAPAINDAWWNALTRLRDHSPPNTVINTWWDFGYWAKYVAERRVSADGASLLTHIPYWLAHALLAPSEDEAAGLLRMLNCASDATPEPEGSQGAWARLVAAGVDPLRAPALISTMAGRDAAGAAALLAELGIDAAERDAILAVTHCAPPPAYLVLSDRLLAMAPLRSLGTFDARRSFALHLADSRSPAEAIAALRQHLGLSLQDATALDRDARIPRSGQQRVEFVSPATDYFARGWQSCAVVDRDMVCAIRALPGAPPLREFRYPRATPAEGALLLATEARGEAQLVLLNDAAGLREVYRAAPTTTQPAAAVLIDVDRQRVLIGPPYLIRSTLTRLLYLDDVAGSRFEQVDAQTVPVERVTVWRVR